MTTAILSHTVLILTPHGIVMIDLEKQSFDGRIIAQQPISRDFALRFLGKAIEIVKQSPED